MKVGEWVKWGQVLALIGASEDAREPHLHFQVADSAKMLEGEGLLYVIDRHRVKSENGWQSRNARAASDVAAIRILLAGQIECFTADLWSSSNTDFHDVGTQSIGVPIQDAAQLRLEFDYRITRQDCSRLRRNA